MHKSLFACAEALECTPGHIRRLIRAGRIPSARLVKGPKGRPGWQIDDTSPQTLAALKLKLADAQHAQSIFWEPVVTEYFENKGPDGRPSLSYQIRWRSNYTPMLTDRFAILCDLAERAALVWHGLTRHDLFHPPVDRSENGVSWLISTSHKRRLQAYDRTQRKLLGALFRSPRSYSNRWVTRMAETSIETIDLMQAALQLALYSKLYEIKTSCRNLCMVLGISKSTLYRRYGRQVNEALRLAHKYARSSTQRGQHQVEREKHPGLKSETVQQSDRAFQSNDDLFAQSDEKHASLDEELHHTAINSPPTDLPFEVVYSVATLMIRSNQAVNAKSLTIYLRRQGLIKSTQHVCDFYSDGVINNAIAAAKVAA